MSATVEIEIASEEDREGPDDVEEAREDADRSTPPKKPAMSAMIVARKQQISAETDADDQRVAAAVEHPRRDVAALVVGAQEVVVDVPRRPDRRHAETEAARALDHDRRTLAVDDRRAVDRRHERVRVRDAVRRTSPPRGTRPRSRRSRRARRARCGCAAGAGLPAPRGCGRRRGPVGPRRRPQRPQTPGRPGLVHYWTHAWSTSM